MADESFHAPSNPVTRTLAFFAEYRALPDDADIEIRVGQTEDGAPAVIVDINRARHAFTVAEALVVADIFESAMNEHPSHPDTRGFPNIIMALRHGAHAARISDAPARERP